MCSILSKLQLLVQQKVLNFHDNQVRRTDQEFKDSEDDTDFIPAVTRQSSKRNSHLGAGSANATLNYATPSQAPQHRRQSQNELVDSIGRGGSSNKTAFRTLEAVVLNSAVRKTTSTQANPSFGDQGYDSTQADRSKRRRATDLLAESVKKRNHVREVRCPELFLHLKLKLTREDVPDSAALAFGARKLHTYPRRQYSAAHGSDSAISISGSGRRCRVRQSTVDG